MLLFFYVRKQEECSQQKSKYSQNPCFTKIYAKKLPSLFIVTIKNHNN